ncbi:MAG TPA: hypothetical protein VK179_18085 [Bacteroidales bacterium]|nr:hypothetical protein [Bacteroidales bacterium]
MDFNEFFEQDHKRNKYHHRPNHGHNHNHDHDHDHQHDDGYSHDEYHQRGSFHGHQNDLKYTILSKLQDPGMRTYLIAGGIVVLLVVLAIIIVLFPLLMKFIHFVGDNGVQGLLDAVWKGTK